jgi:1-acyl-sn-glycerol-3-phosphate acyltransferase
MRACTLERSSVLGLHEQRHRSSNAAPRYRRSQALPRQPLGAANLQAKLKMDARPRAVFGPIWRALRVAEHVLTGTLLALVASLSRRAGRDPNWVPAATRWWHERLCDCLQLEIRCNGSLQPGALLVANHISWLDIPAVGALGRITFLSKDEVRRWPVVGALAKAAGTLFITRGGNQAAAVLEQIGERIDAGVSVMIFAEGTTSDGHSLRRFHPRPFAAAQAAERLLQPVAIRYGSNAEPDPVAPFVGDDTLVTHLLRVLRHPGIKVRIMFLPPIDPKGLERRAMANATRSAIAARLDLGSALAEPARVPRDRPRRRKSTSV